MGLVRHWRRSPLRTAMAIALLPLSLSACVTIADYARPDSLPIVDFHTHLNGDMAAEDLIERMDRAGVRTMVLMARYYANKQDAGYGSDEQANDFAQRYKGRFVPFVAGQRGELGVYSTAWLSPDNIVGQQYLRAAEDKLKSGAFFGLGEFILYHHAYDIVSVGQTGGEVRIPADTALMHRIAELGAKYDVPVVMHLEAEPEQVQQAIRLFAAHPDTTFVWAHNCGRGSAEQTRQLLSKFPRLMCDLGHMMVTPGNPGGYGHYWPRRTKYIHLVQADGGEVYPEMLALFEAFSDRFLLGTDTAHTPFLREYGDRIHAFRQMLSQMTPATAQRIAHENAERLFAAARAKR